MKEKEVKPEEVRKLLRTREEKIREAGKAVARV